MGHPAGVAARFGPGHHRRARWVGSEVNGAPQARPLSGMRSTVDDGGSDADMRGVPAWYLWLSLRDAAASRTVELDIENILGRPEAFFDPRTTKGHDHWPGSGSVYFYH